MNKAQVEMEGRRFAQQLTSIVNDVRESEREKVIALIDQHIASHKKHTENPELIVRALAQVQGVIRSWAYE